MSTLWLLRHGQAGTRQQYDTLSELGRTQARLLGEWLAQRGVRFKAAFSGTLLRQQETGSEVCRAYASAGLEFPEITEDPHWNEFDLDAVFRDVPPVLCAADERFREAYMDIERQALDGAAAVHRKWTWCDVEVVRAWIEGRAACGAESWDEFRARVAGAMDGLAAFGDGDDVAIFTSAVPMGIWAGLSLGIGDYRVMRLAGVLWNCAFNTMRLKDGEAMLLSLNNAPHLARKELRTYR